MCGRSIQNVKVEIGGKIIEVSDCIHLENISGLMKDIT